MFWIVMADEARTSVGFRHPTLELARAEAERLARHAGRRFYVLHVVGHAQPTTPPVEWTPDPLSIDCDVPGAVPVAECPDCPHVVSVHTSSGCLMHVDGNTDYCPCMRDASGVEVPSLDVPSGAAPADAPSAAANDLDDLPF